MPDTAPAAGETPFSAPPSEFDPLVKPAEPTAPVEAVRDVPKVEAPAEDAPALPEDVVTAIPEAAKPEHESLLHRMVDAAKDMGEGVKVAAEDILPSRTVVTGFRTVPANNGQAMVVIVDAISDGNMHQRTRMVPLPCEARHFLRELAALIG